jgi:hypothetical protein
VIDKRVVAQYCSAPKKPMGNYKQDAVADLLLRYDLKLSQCRKLAGG